jgi:hypothetical protein
MTTEELNVIDPNSIVKYQQSRMALGHITVVDGKVTFSPFFYILGGNHREPWVVWDPKFYTQISEAEAALIILEN